MKAYVKLDNPGEPLFAGDLKLLYPELLESEYPPDGYAEISIVIDSSISSYGYYPYKIVGGKNVNGEWISEVSYKYKSSIDYPKTAMQEYLDRARIVSGRYAEDV